MSKSTGRVQEYWLSEEAFLAHWVQYHFTPEQMAEAFEYHVDKEDIHLGKFQCVNPTCHGKASKCLNLRDLLAHYVKHHMDDTDYEWIRSTFPRTRDGADVLEMRRLMELAKRRGERKRDTSTRREIVEEGYETDASVNTQAHNTEPLPRVRRNPNLDNDELIGALRDFAKKAFRNSKYGKRPLEAYQIYAPKAFFKLDASYSAEDYKQYIKNEKFRIDVDLDN